MAKSPAGSRQRPTPARDVAAPVRGHTFPTLQVVGHAGLGIDRTGGATIRRHLAGLWRSHASLPRLRRGVADLHRAARQLRDRPQESLARVAGLPWRERLPLDLALHCDELNPAGVCVHRWLVSERLVDEAHAAGLHVNAWTVNSPDAASLVASAGVDSITSDRVAAIRLAVGLGSHRGSPPLPSVAGSGWRRVARGADLPGAEPQRPCRRLLGGGRGGHKPAVAEDAEEVGEDVAVGTRHHRETRLPQQQVEQR